MRSRAPAIALDVRTRKRSATINKSGIKKIPMTAAAIIPPNRRADGTARSHRNDQQEKPEVTDTGTYIGRVVPIEWVVGLCCVSKNNPR